MDDRCALTIRCIIIEKAIIIKERIYGRPKKRKKKDNSG